MFFSFVSSLPLQTNVNLFPLTLHFKVHATGPQFPLRVEMLKQWLCYVYNKGTETFVVIQVPEI